MKFAIPKETLLKPLQLVNGVIEKRQTMPILSNVLLENTDTTLAITATDLVIEIKAMLVTDSTVNGSITVPLRKFHDTCRSLPDNAILKFEIDSGRAVIRCGKTRFTLMTLPADDFPTVDTESIIHEIFLTQKTIKTLLGKTQFAMALQDVRVYLNGLLFEISSNQIRAVATDGHRLAMCTIKQDCAVDEPIRVIIPRKAVLELSRLLEHIDEDVAFSVGQNFIRVVSSEVTFTSKLIEGNYPDYNQVIPKGDCDVVVADREALKNCLVRASILSNEKYKGIRLDIYNGVLKAIASNPEHEEAEDEVSVEYSGDKAVIGFNVNYLIDAISILSTDNVKINIEKSNGCALITADQDDSALYVVMPMRL